MLSRWLDTRTPESCCPFCGHRLDAAGSPDGAKPSPGDMSVCISCASILIFTDAMAVRRPEPGEVESIFESYPKFAAQMRHAQRLIRELDRRDMPNAKRDA